MYERYAVLRDARGLSDYAVSKATGVGRSTLSQWKTGKHQPDIATLKRISDFFKVPLSELLDGETEVAAPVTALSYSDQALVVAGIYDHTDDMTRALVDRVLGLTHAVA